MMNTISSSTLRTALVLGLAATSAAAQNLMSQYGEVVLAAGESAPGLPGFTIYSTSAFAYGSPVVDQNGTILVQARLDPSGIDDRAIFIGRNGSDMQLVVQSNTQAPGLPAGTMLKSSSTTSGAGLENDPVISPFGELLFLGSNIYDPTTPTNTPTSSDHALFWGPAGGLQLVAREGEQVPGMPAGVLYGSTSFSRQYNKINSNGLVVFKNDMVGATTGGRRRGHADRRSGWAQHCGSRRRPSAGPTGWRAVCRGLGRHDVVPCRHQRHRRYRVLAEAYRPRHRRDQ